MPAKSNGILMARVERSVALRLFQKDEVLVMLGAQRSMAIPPAHAPFAAQKSGANDQMAASCAPFAGHFLVDRDKNRFLNIALTHADD